MAQADSATTTPTPTIASQGAALLTRLSRMAPAPRIPYCHTATGEDIEATRQAIETATDIFVSHLGRLMLALNENMPVTETIDTTDFMCGLADLRSDLGALLMHAGEMRDEDA